MTGSVNAAKTHCPRGHEYTPENTKITQGRRVCRACKQISDQRYRESGPIAKRHQFPARPVILGLSPAVWGRLVAMDCGYKTACLVWTGTIASNGYGVIAIAGRQHKVHRLVYEAVMGPMPRRDSNGALIVSDHLCRNRACANPEHIDPVTDEINVLRGVSFAPANAAKTHCIHGHEFTAENTRITAAGGRECRTCRSAYDSRRASARNAARRERRQAEAQANPPAPRQLRPVRPARPKVAPKAKPAPKPKLAPKPRKLAPCGTLSAHTRHVRHKEPIDQACRDVHATRMRELRAERARVTPTRLVRTPAPNGELR